MKKIVSILLSLILTITLVHSKSITDSSADGRCGKGVGVCKKDECCSKYGWCGKTDKHCKVEEGCQSEFGKCSNNNNNEVSKDGKCGKGIGVCKKDECCSKYGWCGKTDKHCKVEEGCQSEFGKCSNNNNNEVSKDGRCGKGVGVCKKDECCSKYGWCGKTDKHCKVEEGCQSEFGKCNDNNNINNPVNNSTNISHPDFVFSFLKLENNKKNMLYSPLSIKYALNMLKDGANGNTYDEIEKVVGNAELPKYTSIDKNLSLANGLFVRDKFYERVKESYIKALKEKYNAEIVKDEFKDAKNANQWIEDKTLGIIKNMLHDDDVDGSEMLIINALAIDMEWISNFEYENTSGNNFYLDDGKIMSATTMSKENIKGQMFSFYKDDDLTVLTMDLKEYDGVQFEFMAIMPKENLSTFIENVSEEQVDQIDKKLKLASDEKDGINIKIPKFKFDYDLKLKDDLIDLGIKDAFDSNKADLTKIADSNELYVSNALHKADIEFGEDGLKAAAVTVIIVAEGAFPMERHPVDIIINKPFMFIIRDKKTKDVWFTGTVYEPNSWEKDKNSYDSTGDGYGVPE